MCAHCDSEPARYAFGRMSNPERLFRDAEGAALERVARLEDENRRLRTEVERLTRQRDKPQEEDRPTHRLPSAAPHPLPGRFFVLAMALPLTMISLLLAVGPRHHTRSCSPPRYGEAIAPRTFQMTPYVPLDVTPVDPNAPPCAPPWVTDARGRRHYKVECIR